jgi:hypothetical protein
MRLPSMPNAKVSKTVYIEKILPVVQYSMILQTALTALTNVMTVIY